MDWSSTTCSTAIEFYLQESEVDEGLIATNVRKVYAPSHP